jgi:hypothetical protein
MHYFGRSLTDAHDIAVEEHVDPSPLVMQAFRCLDVLRLASIGWVQSDWMGLRRTQLARHSFADREAMRVFVGRDCMSMCKVA